MTTGEALRCVNAGADLLNRLLHRARDPDAGGGERGLGGGRDGRPQRQR
jgi:hypothetical protein